MGWQNADVATFDCPGDEVCGFLAAADFEPDQWDPNHDVLVLVLQSRGVYLKVYARDGMRLAIIEAVAAAGDDELAESAYLTITFVRMQGRRKVYHVSYEPLDPGCCVHPGP